MTIFALLLTWNCLAGFDVPCIAVILSTVIMEYCRNGACSFFILKGLESPPKHSLSLHSLSLGALGGVSKLWLSPFPLAFHCFLGVHFPLLSL